MIVRRRRRFPDRAGVVRFETSFFALATLLVACSASDRISLLLGGSSSGAGGSTGIDAGSGGLGGSSGGAAGSSPGGAPEVDAAPRCTLDVDCAGATRYCDVPSGACVACVEDKNCASKLCDLATHTC